MAFYEDDLDIIFSDFVEDVIYAVSGKFPQDGVTVKGIFDNKGQTVAIFDGHIEATGPQVTVKSSDITGVKHSDTVTIRNKTWYIRGIEDDGTGITVLTISED